MTLTTDTQTALYEQDYQRWLQQPLAQLRLGELEALDRAHLIEASEDLGKRDQRAIASDLMRLCEHLLKVKYWVGERDLCLRDWDVEIANFRIQIQRSPKIVLGSEVFYQSNLSWNTKMGGPYFSRLVELT